LGGLRPQRPQEPGDQTIQSPHFLPADFQRLPHLVRRLSRGFAKILFHHLQLQMQAVQRIANLVGHLRRQHRQRLSPPRLYRRFRLDSLPGRIVENRNVSRTIPILFLQRH